MPLFKYETWPGGHDSNGTIFNAWSMVETLRKDFHLPLLWQADNCGFKGNPYWAFYQPFSCFVIYLISLLASTVQDNYFFPSMKWAVYASFLISEITMFFLLKTISKDSEIKNLVSGYGALIYLLAPYRFIDLYSRNAYAELWVFPWMPLYLLGFYKLFFSKELSGWYLIAISTPLLFFSHLMPSFFFILIVHLGFLLSLLFQKRFFLFINQNLHIIFWWFISNVIGIILSSFYVFPAINVVKSINGDIIGFDRVSLGNVLEHISWCYAMLDLSNFKGAWQVGQLYLLSFVVLIFLIFFTKRTMQHKDFIIFLCMSTLVTFIFLMSRTLWEHLPKVLYSLQFSWRLFTAYSFLCSVIVALLVNELKIKIPILILLLLFHFYTGERFLHYGSEDVVAKHFDAESWLNGHYRQNYTTLNNYSPHSILPKTSEPVFFSFDHADEIGTNEKFSNTYLLNLKPGVNILSYEHRGNTFVYELLLDNPAFIIFKQYFYPTWELYIDLKRSKNLYLTDFGYVGFEVPTGRHIIRLRSN